MVGNENDFKALSCLKWLDHGYQNLDALDNIEIDFSITKFAATLNKNFISNYPSKGLDLQMLTSYFCLLPPYKPSGEIFSPEGRLVVLRSPIPADSCHQMSDLKKVHQCHHNQAYRHCKKYHSRSPEQGLYFHFIVLS